MRGLALGPALDHELLALGGPIMERFRFPRIIGRTARNTVRGCEVTDFVFADVMGFQGRWVLCRNLELA